MSWIPRFKLWNSAGDSLLYTFEAVQYTNAPQSAQKTVEIEGIRGQGSIIIDGATSSWDLVVETFFAEDSYEELMAKVISLESTIALNTAYRLRIDKQQSPATYWEYNVKRLLPIQYDRSLRTSHQLCIVTFKANSW